MILDSSWDSHPASCKFGAIGWKRNVAHHTDRATASRQARTVAIHPSTAAPPGNRLLAALPVAARRRLLASAERVELTLATVLCGQGMALSHVFFPLDSFVALIASAKGNVELEVGMVGNEGMLGATLMLGVKAAPLQWLVRGAGQAWRIEAASFLRMLAALPALRRLLNKYLYVAVVQLAQTSICKRFHVVEARLARWLLMTRDRAHADRFVITHEILAHIMGVRRAGVTRAANSLQQRKLIKYHRGKLQILDGHALETAACNCYATDKSTYARVMD
jgi:CRP-like cAMP-binding protein